MWIREDDVHGERIPPVLAWESYAGDAAEHELCLDPVALSIVQVDTRSKAPARQQRHSCEGHVFECSLILSVRYEEGIAHSRIVKERFPDGWCDFLEKDNVGVLWCFEDAVEDVFGARNGPWREGINVPRHEGEPRRWDGVGVAWCEGERWC